MRQRGTERKQEEIETDLLKSLIQKQLHVVSEYKALARYTTIQNSWNLYWILPLKINKCAKDMSFVSRLTSIQYTVCLTKLKRYPLVLGLITYKWCERNAHSSHGVNGSKIKSWQRGLGKILGIIYFYSDEISLALNGGNFLLQKPLSLMNWAVCDVLYNGWGGYRYYINTAFRLGAPPWPQTSESEGANVVKQAKDWKAKRWIRKMRDCFLIVSGWFCSNKNSHTSAPAQEKGPNADGVHVSWLEGNETTATKKMPQTQQVQKKIQTEERVSAYKYTSAHFKVITERDYLCTNRQNYVYLYTWSVLIH